VLIALAGAVLVCGVAIRIWRWREREGPTRADTRWLLGLLLVSTLSHLVLDWTNSYGVHPFWPVDNRWHYGDAVFIVEPWFWVLSVPTLIAASARSTPRVVLSLVMLSGLVLAWRLDFVSRGAAATLTVGALVSVAVAFVLHPGARAAVAIAGWIAATLVMAAGSARARATTLRAVHDAAPDAEVLDVVVSPMPANPVCASVISLERSGPEYLIATARVSALPSLVEAAHCGSRQGGGGGGGDGSLFQPSARRSTSGLQWDGAWSAPVADIASLGRASCPAFAAMRFIRAPIWRVLGDSTVLLGDARFGGGSGNGFTDVRVPRNSAGCPTAVPPWTPPRADLLGF
jgi:inner membrane protein